MTAMPRSASHPASRVRARNLVTIASGKGGVGKTWLATTLAHALARAGQRTLLFDGDLGLANVDVQLNLSVDRDIADVVGGRTSLAEAITTYDEGGFDIVAGKSGSGALASLPERHVEALREALMELAKRYDRVIVDQGAGLDAPLRNLTRGGGKTLIVATDEPTSLTDAYASVGALENACRTFLRLSPPLLGIVRRDDKVRDAIRRQTPLLVRHPTAAAAADVEALAAAIIAAG
jgi:flagellar biosynthesis protein FlhG